MPGSKNELIAPDRDIEQLLALFKNFINARVDLREPIFNDGCEPSVVDEMEATIKASLPADYKALLKHGNGTRDELTLTFPPNRLSFLSADEVMGAWRYFAENPEEEFFNEFTFDDKVRSVLMHPGRVPIAQNESGGRYLAIDYIPGPRGKVGQLVFNINEADCVVLEDSVTALVDRYVRALEAGKLAIERIPEEYLGLYWFRSNGRHVDYEIYRNLGV